MASSSGTSSGSITTILSNSGSEGDLQQNVIDQRKQKRMLSNRESARRSRMRKQKHLDDLMAQVAQLRKENNHILTTYKITAQQHLALEAENSVLRTQVVELSNRLQSLHEILNYMDDGYSNGYVCADDGATQLQAMDSGSGSGSGSMMMMNMTNNPWNLVYVNQPIMASPDMFLY